MVPARLPCRPDAPDELRRVGFREVGEDPCDTWRSQVVVLDQVHRCWPR